MSKNILAGLITALLAVAPVAAIAAEAKAPDRQAACSAAREQARKEAGKKAQLSECKCDKPAADGSLVCRVTSQ